MQIQKPSDRRRRATTWRDCGISCLYQELRKNHAKATKEATGSGTRSCCRVQKQRAGCPRNRQFQPQTTRSWVLDARPKRLSRLYKTQATPRVATAEEMERQIHGKFMPQPQNDAAASVGRGYRILTPHYGIATVAVKNLPAPFRHPWTLSCAFSSVDLI